MTSSVNVPSTRSVQEGEAGDRTETLVVFVGQAECACLRWLKQDFKHCFVALHIDGRWVICDSLKNYMEFSLVKLPPDFSLSEFYRSRGYTVLLGHAHHYEVQSVTVPEVFTCVAVVKRIIGLRSFWTFTPWQLFRRLLSMKDQWRLVD